jgi:metacaspase-1
MLAARRFTAIPTQDCRRRLEDALSNARPIARGEAHRAAVAAIQAALSDLNRGYLVEAEVDGFFGLRTAAAVEAFQRDYGLAADGIVGQQTMRQLDTLYTSDVIRQPVGRSVHIGVDYVDRNHYGSDFPLASCVNDARKMCEIAESLGYDATTFENEEATVANFTGAIRGAISDLFPGDSLMITFSGHGSQLPNNSDDVEADLLDETLCFYDRMMIDDELFALLAQLREGVRVHAVFDSCHSGTVHKDPLVNHIPLGFKEVQEIFFSETNKTLKQLTTVTTVTVLAPDPEQPEKIIEQPISGQPISTKELSKALDDEEPAMSEPPKPKKSLDDDVASLFADLNTYARTGRPKGIDAKESFPIYKLNKNLYDAIKNVVGPQENQHLSCTLVSLSACQDSQTTPAGQVYSLFTYNIMTAWDKGFTGSYNQFYRSLMNVAPSDATQALNTEGSRLAEARLYDRPFVF